MSMASHIGRAFTIVLLVVGAALLAVGLFAAAYAVPMWWAMSACSDEQPARTSFVLEPGARATLVEPGLCPARILRIQLAEKPGEVARRCGEGQCGLRADWTLEVGDEAASSGVLVAGPDATARNRFEDEGDCAVRFDLMPDPPLVFHVTLREVSPALVGVEATLWGESNIQEGYGLMAAIFTMFAIVLALVGGGALLAGRFRLRRRSHSPGVSENSMAEPSGAEKPGAGDERLAARLDALRRRFATGLVGRWHSAQGTLDMVMGERWEFRADGTGSSWSHSALHGEDETAFTWRHHGPNAVVVSLPDEEDRDALLDGAAERVVHYEFAIVRHDLGQDVVLREVGCEGFWFGLAPLRPLP